MNPTIKKAILFAVGAVSLTQEKISSFVKDLENEGALNKEEGEELVKEFLKQSEQRTNEFRGIVEKEVRRVLADMGKTAEDIKPAEAEQV
jgi:polyhydroxyalkanoate synthesis regulator phasin